MKDFLLDSWEVTGNQFNELYEVLEYLSNSTQVLDTRTDVLGILTCKNPSEALGENGDSLNGYLHDKVGTYNKGISVDWLTKKYGATPALIDETINQSHMLFKLGEGYFFTTKSVLKTLCQRAGSAMGDFALRDEIKIRFHRDAGYVQYMSAVPSQCKVLYREDKGAKKAFAVFASRYRIIPQYPLIKYLVEGFEKEMGKAVLIHYIVNHFDTEIFIEFPEKTKDFQKVYSLPEDVIPGIRIHISDTGESSFIINGTLRMKNMTIYIPGAKYARAHTTKAEIDAITEAVEQKIFAEYTKIPERLVELLQIDLTANKVQNLIPKVSRFCQIKETLGKKVEERMVENITGYINKKSSYTAYDIFMMFVEAGYELEDEYKSNSDTITKIRSTFIQSAFYKYA